MSNMTANNTTNLHSMAYLELNFPLESTFLDLNAWRSCMPRQQYLHRISNKIPLNMELSALFSTMIPAIHYLAPTTVILLYHLYALLSTRKRTSAKSLGSENGYVALYSTLLIFLPCLGILGSYLVQSVIILRCQFSFSSLAQNETTICLNRPSDDFIINSLASFLVWSILLYNGKMLHSLFSCILCIVAASEFVLFSLNSLRSGNVDRILYTCSVSRLCMLITLLIIVHYGGEGSTRHSIAPLSAVSPTESKNSKDSGSSASDLDSDESIPADWDDGDWEEDEELERLMRAHQKKRFKASANWWQYIKPFKVLFRFVFPQKDSRVVILMSVSIMLVLIERAIPPLLTRQLGIITDNLLVFSKTTTSSAISEAASSSSVTPYTVSQDIAVWLILTWLSSSGGLSAFACLVRMPLSITSRRATTLATYDHLMSLSANFHDSKNPAEVINSVVFNRSMYRLFEKLVTELIPAFLDLIISGIYLYSLFGAYAAFILVIVAYAFIAFDLHFKARAVTSRRTSNKAWTQQYHAQNRALEGWRAVRSFNNFDFERQRLVRAIDTRMDAEWEREHINFMDRMCTGNTMNVALVPVCILAILAIHAGVAPVGHFLAMISIWLQLSHPLRVVNDQSKDLLESLVDLERLLFIFDLQPDIVDAPDAKPLQLTRGDVTFENVSFAYDARKTVLHSVSLNNTAGRTIALVGESGGGKSTLLQLISRMYDVTEGAIKIDGQDLRSVTQQSLRTAIGVVPQSPHMFNTSILENLRYALRGRSSSSSSSSSTTAAVNEPATSTTSTTSTTAQRTEEEEETQRIHNACRAASIHDKIMTFPDGYASLVGENGIKLSGGELQRLAIAQVLLQDPRLVLLDEATSAVDTLTERQIQAALRQLTTGRTAFVIAHRLSTIMGADEILVVHSGEIVERGTHLDLVEREGGRYKALWEGQVLASSSSLSPPSPPPSSSSSSKD